MTTIFTDHVRLLADGAEPSPEHLRELFETIYRTLRRELDARCLLHLPPAALGYPGLASWTAPAALGDGEVERARLLTGTARAFEEIVADAYVEVVLKSPARRAANAKAVGPIDGAVILGLGRFVTARQRVGDRAGYAVFCNCEGALESGCRDGWLAASDRVESRIRNRTLLAFTQAGAGVDEALPDVLLTGITRRDPSGTLLVDIGLVGRAVARRLAAVLRTLPGEGIRSFRFRSLMDAAKPEARAGRKALMEDALQSPPASGVERVEDDRAWDRLRRQVDALIDRSPHRSDRKRALRALLDELDAQREAAPDAPLPRDAELARRMGIARQTLSDRLRCLRTLFLLAQLEDLPDDEVRRDLEHPARLAARIGATGDRMQQHAETALAHEKGLALPRDTAPLRAEALLVVLRAAAGVRVTSLASAPNAQGR